MADVSPEKTERLPLSRSVRMLRDDLQPIVQQASKKIIDRTLFEKPFPAGCEVSTWITEIWEDTLKAEGREYETCSEACKRDVSKSLYVMMFRR